MPDRDALDAAMDALGDAERYLDRLRQRDLSKMEGRITNWTPGHHYAEVERAGVAVGAARAAVRKAAREMGEEFEVEHIQYNGYNTQGIAFTGNEFRPGDRVRVVKVEPNDG